MVAIAPLRARASITRAKRDGDVAVAAYGNDGYGNGSAPNSRASPYTAPSGRDMPRPRDMYEGTTGIDVLALQKDLVAEGFLSPRDASGCVHRTISPWHSIDQTFLRPFSFVSRGARARSRARSTPRVRVVPRRASEKSYNVPHQRLSHHLAQGLLPRDALRDRAHAAAVRPPDQRRLGISRAPGLRQRARDDRAARERAVLAPARVE
eukprot:31342-Pelagococcus_subviridis.AAC.46